MTILHTQQGGTGTSSVPYENQILVADADGNYQPEDIMVAIPSAFYWTRNLINGYLYPTTLTDKLGLGTSTPTQQLDMTGNINIVNTTYANQNGIIYKNGNRFISDFNYGNNGTVTTDGYNTFIGINAGNLTMGSTATQTYHSSYNTGIGKGALYNNTTGYYNTALGYSALYNNTTGYLNIAVGHASLYMNTTGIFNTAIGGNSGRYIADGSTGNQTSNNSTYLGSNTKALADGDTNETVIGYNATGVGSNSVVLGNDSVTKTILKGNVGIGTTSPNTTLEVYAGSDSSSILWGETIRNNANANVLNYGSGIKLKISSESADTELNKWVGLAAVAGTAWSNRPDLAIYLTPTSASAPSERVRITGNGSVGIGTTSPSTKLDVVGGGIRTDSSVVSPLVMNANTLGITDLTLQSASGDIILTPASGYGVGIGTTNPTSLLQLTSANPIITLQSIGTNANGIQFANNNGSADAGIMYNSVSGGAIEFRTGGISTSNRSMVILSSGNIGIGTTTPSKRLDVAGDINIADTYSIYKSGIKVIDFTNGTDTFYANIAIGQNAGNSSSTRQTALGMYAGQLNTGVYQTALGYYAGYFNTGSAQTALGYQAGYFNTGVYQTALGFYAGGLNTGNYQTALGFFAGQLNTGTQQTALGYYAGQYNDGSTNTAVGYSAFNNFNLDTSKTKTFDYTAIDASTNYITIPSHGLGSAGTYLNMKFIQGTSAITGMSNNTVYKFKIIDANTLELYITDITNAGTGTGHTLTPQLVYSNSGAFGYDAEPDASNQIVLGNTAITQVKTSGAIYSTSTGNNYFAGNVGIGTTDLDGTPAIGRLTVKGTTNDGSTNILVLRDSDETNVVSVDTDGHIYSTGTFGEIYGHDNATAQSIPTGATYTKITTAYTANGLYSGTTVDEANGKITVLKAGKYRVFYTLSYFSGTDNVQWYGAVFNDGTECSNIHSSTKITTGTDMRTTSAQGIITVGANKEIDFRVRHDQAGAVNITPVYINLNVEYLGE